MIATVPGFLGVTQKDFSNQCLQDAINELPDRALLVIEDVDVLFNEDRKAETSTILTFSGLLNALDGLVSGTGTITVLTTNHIEKLDSALIRGGRVDRRFEFVHPGKEQLEDLFHSYYPTAENRIAQKFAQTVLARTEKDANSIATLQQHFIRTRELNAQQCLDAMSEFCVNCAGKMGNRCKFHYTATKTSHVYL